MKIRVLLGSVAFIAIGAAAYLMTNQSSDSRLYEPKSAEASANDETYGGMGGQEYFDQFRSNYHTGEVNPQDALEAWEAVKVEQRKSSGRSLGLQFNELGPDNIGGRTRVVLFDQNDPDGRTIWTGGVSGGLFKSVNGGATWEVHPDFISTANTPLAELSLHISSMCQTPNGDIYVGTGSTFEGSASGPGRGVYKSTDGGVSFTQIPSTVPTANVAGGPWAYINRMAADADGNVYAGTNTGLRVTTDGGQTWFNPVNITDGNCLTKATSRVADIEINADGRLYVVAGSQLHYSDDPTTDCSYSTATGFNGKQRCDVAIAPSNENRMYSIVVSGGFLDGIIMSDDAGESWVPHSPAAPSTAIDSTFALFGDNGQGNYDLCITVSPINEDRIFVGGVQFYYIDGSWTRAAEWFLTPTNPFYVHADAHYLKFDPNNPNRLFIASDGGIGITENANDQTPTFVTANRGYNVTQFYAMSFAPDGRVIAGAQDNGTLLVDPNNAGNSQSGVEIGGGDGMGNDVSQLVPVAFISSQNGNVTRVEEGGQGTFLGSFAGPFVTRIRLWESFNDPTSKDSLTFNADEVRLGIGSGDDTRRIFSGTLTPPQSAAVITPGSVRFEAGTQVAEDPDGDGSLTDISGDSIGVFDYSNYSYTFTLPTAPAQGLLVYGFFTATYQTGDTLFLFSETRDFPFEYELPIDLNEGDSIRIQDPFQSILAISTSQGAALTRDALRVGIPSWFTVPGIGGGVTCIEFTSDGNTAFIGTFSGLYRVSGLNNWYHDSVMADVTTTTLLRANTRVSGIAINPHDEERIIYTTGQFGSPNGNAFELVNALSAASSAGVTVRNLQGNLPAMPVYDAEYNIAEDNSEVVLLGTEFGLWGTDNVSSNPVVWSDQSGSMANVMVLEIRQQQRPSWLAANFDAFYVATHGRGMWTTSTLVGQPSSTPDYGAWNDDEFEASVGIFPNPAVNHTTLTFDLATASPVDIRIMNLEGRIVKTVNERTFQAGENSLQISTTDLAGGTYFVAARAGEAYGVAKLVVVK